ncbi:MAG: murein L,D-transpeptidase [Sulfurovum sp.]|nr:murein L,D-transpeptidase [Sulfurovum sp.]
MRRIGLLLADILVSVLLLRSFVLLFLYRSDYRPPRVVPTEVQPKMQAMEHNESNGTTLFPPDLNVTRSLLNEFNVSEVNKSVTMSLEEIMQLSQEVAMQEYLERSKYLYTPLKQRLEAIGGKKGDPIYIRIFKSEAMLEVWMEVDGIYKHIKDYTICAYSGHLGPKLKEGDRQAPEGFYRVYKKQLNPHSKFHLAFNLGYPNAYDRAHHRSGSYLMVHGDCRSIGCYAMTDAKIEEIYTLVEAALKAGQLYVPVHIFPFYMDGETMAHYSNHRWYDFWTKLKEGYDYFEAEERPPHVEVVNGDYVISEAKE